MDKKNYIWLVVGVVVVVAVIYLLVSSSSTGNMTDKAKSGNPSGAAPALNNNGTPAVPGGDNTPISVQDTTPPKENIIAVEGDSFSPKSLEVTSGTKVFMTLSARDAKKHTMAFEDEDLSFITVSFNKEEGDKSITFVAPKAGTYSFYVDSKSNKGTMIVK